MVPKDYIIFLVYFESVPVIIPIFSCSSSSFNLRTTVWYFFFKEFLIYNMQNRKIDYKEHIYQKQLTSRIKYNLIKWQAYFYFEFRDASSSIVFARWANFRTTWWTLEIFPRSDDRGQRDETIRRRTERSETEVRQTKKSLTPFLLVQISFFRISHSVYQFWNASQKKSAKCHV